jgi:YfiH family protein
MKKIIRYKFFSINHGSSTGIYKSLNCGLKSFDNKKNVKQNLNLAKRSLFKKNKNLIIPDQYHSNKCLVAKANNLNPKCDALVTSDNSLILGITTADCLPIIFYDPENQVIGIAHAGWKGLVKGVIQNTVKKMISLGAQKKSMKSIIGPCIRVKSYEVNEEFVNNLKTKYQRFAIRQTQKIYFDLPKLAKYILLESNISSVHDIKKNTFLDKNYFSFRESKKKKQKDYGRNINLVSII